MEIEADRKNLVKVLELVKPGLGNEDWIEQSAQVVFTKGLEDPVTAITFNDEISIQHPIPELEGIEGAVRVQELHVLLNRMTTDKIKISVDDENTELKVKSGRTSAGFMLQSEIKLPIDEMELGNRKWRKPPKKFVDALRFASPLASKDPSRQILTCVYIEGPEVVSSNGIGLARIKFGRTVMSKNTAIALPASTCDQLIKMLDLSKATLTGFALDKNGRWVHFKSSEDTTFSCRLYAGEFPDVSKLWKVKGNTFSLPDDIAKILIRAQSIYKRQYEIDEEVHVDLEDGMMTVKAYTDAGWFTEDTEVDYSGDNISFIVNPSSLIRVQSGNAGFLLNNQSSKDEEQVPVACTIGENRMKFEGQNYEYIVALEYPKE